MKIIPHHLEIKPYCFDLYPSINLDKIKKLILQYKQDNPISNTSNVYAWHTDYFLHEKTTIFNDLIDTISSNVSSLDKTEGYVPKLINSWAIIYDKLNSTINHNHRPSAYSTILYVDVDENSAPTIFEGNITINPVKGQLVIFPGTLNHYVPICTSDKQRIVFCCNFF
jgi:hypothetical protein